MLSRATNLDPVTLAALFEALIYVFQIFHKRGEL